MTVCYCTEKQSLEQQAVGILSKRASRIVRGVLNRLVNKVVKGYKIWKVQQRRLRMAAGTLFALYCEISTDSVVS